MYGILEFLSRVVVILAEGATPLLSPSDAWRSWWSTPDLARRSAASGVSYSSFCLLGELLVDPLELDRFFFRELGRSDGRVESIVAHVGADHPAAVVEGDPQ